MVKLRKQKLSGKKHKKYSLFLDIYVNGNRQRDFLKLYLTGNKETDKETLRLAEAIRAKKLLELQAGQYGFIPEFKKRANFIDYFEKIRKEKNKDKKSSFYNNTYKHLKDFTNSIIHINAIDEKWLISFRDYLLTKVMPNSVYCYFNCLNAVLNKAVKDKLIQVNPFFYLDKKDKPKQTTVFKTYLATEELQTLADTPCNKPEIKRAFLFACYTGMRYSDIKALKWCDIQDGQIKFRQQKTGEIVYLPLSVTAIKLLYSNNSNILPMPEVNVFTLQSDRINQTSLIEWTQQASLTKKVTWHTARHTFATQSLEAGSDLYTVSKLLGHSSIRLTEIYAKVSSESKRQRSRCIK